MKAVSPERLEVMQEGVARLVTLGAALFPRVLANDAGPEKVLSASLVARAVGSAEAANELAPLGRQADMATVARSLYEHVVTLAWLNGADSRNRVIAWQIDDDRRRLILDREVSALIGRPVLTDENRKRSAPPPKDADVPGLPSLADRAAQADQEWHSRLGVGDPKRPMFSLRSAYSTLYRMASAVAHPTLVGMNFVAERTDDKTVVFMEGTQSAGVTLGMVVPLLGTALYVSSDVLGAPRVHEVNEFFEWFSPALTATP